MKEPVNKPWHKINLADRKPIVEQCKTAALTVLPDPKDKEKKITVDTPCPRIDGELCTTYLSPEIKWRTGCPFARHVISSSDAKINPLKASKRAAAGTK